MDANSVRHRHSRSDPTTLHRGRFFHVLAPILRLGLRRGVFNNQAKKTPSFGSPASAQIASFGSLSNKTCVCPLDDQRIPRLLMEFWFPPTASSSSFGSPAYPTTLAIRHFLTLYLVFWFPRIGAVKRHIEFWLPCRQRFLKALAPCQTGLSLCFGSPPSPTSWLAAPHIRFSNLFLASLSVFTLLITLGVFRNVKKVEGRIFHCL